MWRSRATRRETPRRTEVNTLIYDVNIAALCEVLPLAVKAGLDPTTVADVVTSGSARSFASE